MRYINNTNILIACSGGIDSVFLMYYFSDMKKKENLTLHTCYVDHKLRSESVSEAKFVDKICQKLEIPFHSLSFNPDFWEGSSSNMEERARKERYRILYNLAIELKCKYIATGHHLDDQVETILMRLFDCGTGIKGLAGIKPVSLIEHIGSPLHKSKGTVKIIRPLLHMSRKEIEEQMAGKEYISDSSNENTILKRNHFRKNVIPAIENALSSDKFKKHISDLSLNVQRELEFTSEMAKEFWINLRKDNRAFIISRELIEKHSDNFWLTAFSYLFSEYRDFSHCTNALIDIVAFIRKKDPATANYDPFIFIRDKEGVRINNSP